MQWWWCALLFLHMIIYCTINKGSNRSKCFLQTRCLNFNTMCFVSIFVHMLLLYFIYDERAVNYCCILRLNCMITIFIPCIFCTPNYIINVVVLDKSLFYFIKCHNLYLNSAKRAFLIIYLVQHTIQQQDMSIILGQSKYFYCGT